jgi:hypothetical protein
VTREGFQARCGSDSLAFLIGEEAGMVAVAITRMEHTAQDLRAVAKRSDDVCSGAADTGLGVGAGRQIPQRGGNVLRDGSPEPARLGASPQCRRSERTAQSNRPRGEAGLSSEQERAVVELVRNGPNLAEHGVVRWRRIDLAHVIEQRYGVKLAERSVGDLLRRLGFRGLSVRPLLSRAGR